MDMPASLRRLRPFLPRIARVIAFRYLCYAAMMALCLCAERRPAPHLPDLLVDRIPYRPLVDHYNVWLLLFAYLPMNLLLLGWSPARFCRYTVTSGLLSLLRGGCVLLTGLGPVRGPDVNAGLPPAALRRAFLDLVNPVGVFLRDAPHLYMTKDLFFSGHTAVTFLILLYVWPQPRLRRITLAAHLLVVASVFLSHLHYSIDVVGAYAVAFSLFVLREGRPGQIVSDRSGGGEEGLGALRGGAEEV